MHLEIGISKNDCLSKVASDLFCFSIKDNNNTKKTHKPTVKQKYFQSLNLSKFDHFIYQ